MAKKVIAVDIDDTMVMHFPDLMTWYNQKYGTKLTPADNHPSSMEPWGATTYEEAVKRVHPFFDTEIFKNAKPYDEAVGVLKILRKKYELVVITSRDTIIEKLTTDWLEKHFTEIFKEVHFTAFYSLDGMARSKADVCLSTGASYIIDDVFETVKSAADVGIQAVLFGDYEWNRVPALPAGITRCKDWPAVLEYFSGRD